MGKAEYKTTESGRTTSDRKFASTGFAILLNADC